MFSPGRPIRCSAGVYHVGPILLVGLAMTAWPAWCRAQSIESYFPSGVAGSEQQLGVTVLSRQRPLYEAPGIQLGGFTVRPRIDQSIFYNSNVNAVPGSSSLGSSTATSVSATSNWVRNSLSMSVGMNNLRYFSFPAENHTDWNLGIGGGYTIADSQLIFAYSHQSIHQLGTTLGTLRSQTPALNRTDSVLTAYTFQFGDLAITPDASVSANRFGTATVSGVPLSQRVFDNNVLAGGLTARYSRGETGGLLLVARALAANYINPQPGFPSNDYNSFAILGGFDYQAEGVLRYRLLAGLEVRSFAAPQVGTSTSPSIEGSVVWTPTGLTTLTGFLSRRIEPPQTFGLNGYVLTQSRIVIDHEYMRNVFLQARASAQLAQYLPRGSQTNFTVGAGVSWLLNRRLRLSLDYDFTRQSAISNGGGTTGRVLLVSGQYVQSLATLTLHVAL